MSIFQKFKAVNKVVEIPVDMICANPNQPRKEFDEYALKQLSDSIKENGLLQPISVRKLSDEKYEIIAGERRYRACRMLGMSDITCVISEVSEYNSAILSLIENIQRRELNFFEEAEAYDQLIKKFNMTQEQVASRLGKAQSTVANKLRLNRLPKKICRKGRRDYYSGI